MSVGALWNDQKGIEIATDSISSHAIINLLIRWPTIVPVRFRQETFFKYLGIITSVEKIIFWLNIQYDTELITTKNDFEWTGKKVIKRDCWFNFGVLLGDLL